MKALLLIPLLSSCVYQSVSQVDIKKAAELCGSVEEVYLIKASFAGTEDIHCLNGKKYRLDGWFSNDEDER